MNKINAKGLKHGYWETYWGNGYFLFKCVYHNGKRIGYGETYLPYEKLKLKRFNL